MSPAIDPSRQPRHVAQWRELVASGGDPVPWLEHCRALAQSDAAPHAWISLASTEHWQAQLSLLAGRLAEPLPRAELVQRYPLLGVPFAAKDNIDIAGIRTSAACSAFGPVPARSATVVQRLLDAGALWLGKTNLDQFATGLVGTRSPYGRPASVYDARRISGGSSSGSAVAVASGQAPTLQVRAACRLASTPSWA
jgi:allophanate hydrolase